MTKPTGASGIARIHWSRGASGARAGLRYALLSPVILVLAAATLTGAQETADHAADPLAVEAIASRLARVQVERVATDGKGEIAESLLALETVLIREREIAQALSTDSVAAPASPILEEAPSIDTLAALHLARVVALNAQKEREAAITAAEHERTLAEEEAEILERELRQLRESEVAKATARGATQLKLAALTAQLAREKVHVRTLVLRKLRAERGNAKRLDAIAARIAAVESALRRGDSRVAQGTRSAIELEAALIREQELRDRELAGLAVRIESIESRFASDQGADVALLTAAEALRAAQAALRSAIEVLDRRLERLRDRRVFLETWEGALRDAFSTRDRAEALTRMRARLALISQATSRLDVRVEAQQRGLDVLGSRIEDGTPPPLVEDALGVQRTSVRTLLRAQKEALADLDDERVLVEACLEALEGESFDPERIAREAVERGRAFWNYELAQVQDSGITLGALISALAMLWVGAWGSRRLSRFLSAATARRFRLDAGAAQAIETLAFYLFVSSFALLALRVVHFPLTAFTFAGGALAIGLGFGSQNVMNNFISGLILMLERPVRAHDTVEVDGAYGTIERIGARSTQIRANDGRQIIVPNSFFLESNVVNWTLSDELIRTKVVVGVAYGSPTRLVEELIAGVVADEPDVLERPPPIILFDEFGNDSLVFEVYFWVQARAPMRLSQTESRIRFAIDDAFREHGVVIAFPQRDVHLDTTRPLDVRMLPGDSETS